MTTMNPFDLLGDEDAEDPSQLSAAHRPVAAAAKKPALVAQPIKPVAKLPTKPLPPAQAVREAKNEASRGGRGGSRRYGRGRGNNENPSSGEGEYGRPTERRSYGGDTERRSYGGDSEKRGYGGDAERRSYGAPRGAFRGGRRGAGDFNNGEVGDGDRPPRRPYERHSGTGRGSEFKRDGSGRGNWGIETDASAPVTEEAVYETEKNLSDEKPVGEEGVTDANKDSPAEPEEKEPEDKEMTLEEYEKVLEEKRKALQALKTEERKVDTKAFSSMQQLSSKKDNNEIFAKLGSEKDRKKEAAEKEEKAKKAVSINEFLKPADGERHYSAGGRGRGRGRGGSRGGFSSGNFQNNATSAAAPPIEDPGHFPSLGGK